MAEIVLTTEDLIVLGGPETVNVEIDYGSKGDRGSLVFVGNQKPLDDPEDFEDLIGTAPSIFDLYINLLTTDDEYLMIYQYIDSLGSKQWQPLTKLIPNTYSANKNIDFSTENYCYIPISEIVDPSYVGGVNASNFNVQVTFGTSAGYPIVSSIKTEVVSVSSIQNLKITFYAKEFDGTNWIDISGSRTANLHISVV